MSEPVASSEDRCYRFGGFDFDARALALRKGGRILRARPQSLKLLTLLLSRAGELVSRDDIQHELWGRDTFVDFEQGVNHCIKELRAALGDAAEVPRYIQTIPRRGYKFIAPVERIVVGTTDISTGPASAPSSEPASEPSSPVVASAGTSAVTSRTDGIRPYTRRAWLVAAGAAMVMAGAFVASRAAWPRSPTPHASALVVHSFSAPNDPVLGVGLSNAISARLGGQQHLSIQSMGRSGGGLASLGSEANDGDTPSGSLLVLDGELAGSGPDIAVLIRLTAPHSTAPVWSDRFVVRTNELFSAEDVIAERVVDALDLRLAAVEQDRLRRRYTSNGAAYDQYLRGRAALLRYTPDGTLEAIQAFERALQLDRQYALARAGLAMACADMYLRFARADEVGRWGERTETEARAALDLDADLAEAHLARAAVARKREFDWNTTMTASRRALVLNPNLDQARFFMSAAYYHLGYMEEALIEMNKGRRLRGGDVIEPIRIEALVALFSGNFGVALARLQEVSRLSSQAIGDTYLALAYYYSGNVERGRTMLESLTANSSASTAARSSAALAGILAAQGETAAANAQLVKVLAREYRDHHVAYSVAAAYAQLGEADKALRWLHTAADTGFPCVTWFERDPLLEPVRRRPEFQELQGYVRARRESSLSK